MAGWFALARFAFAIAVTLSATIQSSLHVNTQVLWFKLSYSPYVHKQVPQAGLLLLVTVVTPLAWSFYIVLSSVVVTVAVVLGRDQPKCAQLLSKHQHVAMCLIDFCFHFNCDLNLIYTFQITSGHCTYPVLHRYGRLM